MLRFPSDGGIARLYRVPTLEPSSWKAEDKLPPVDHVVGADPEQGLVFSLDNKRNLITLDLETRRVRTYLDQVRAAAMGPDGALYAVDTGSTVTQMVRRAPVRFRSKLQGAPRELHATMTGALLARVGDKAPVLEVLGSDQAPVSTTLPSEHIAPSFYGDLVAVATDTAVIVYETQGKRPPRSIRLSGHPRAVLFSPSGHRLYVAQEDDELLVLDRYSFDRLATIDLPGPAKALRGDRFGQWLLVQPRLGRYRLGRRHRPRAPQGRRAPPGGPPICRPSPRPTRCWSAGARMSWRSTSARRVFPESGRVADGAADEWLAIAWRPARTRRPRDRRLHRGREHRQRRGRARRSTSR